MGDLETTQSKLRSTPTAGVAGEHSAYYRRLLSAGYKGYVQGSIGGATLYGAMGLAIGAAVALPAMALVSVPIALAIVPVLGGIGMLHGAKTFADIGKTAAIIAESAETNEQRRYLLDRYHETPSEEEAQAIKAQLENQMKPKPPEKLFHWKPALVGAAIGLALTAGFLLFAASPLGTSVLGIKLSVILGDLGLPALSAAISNSGIGALASGAGAGLLAIGTAVGSLAGGIIGLDREYVRRWLDGAEFVVHDPANAKKQIAAREQEINQLGETVRRLEQQPTPPANPGIIKVRADEKPTAPIAPTLSAAARRPDPIAPEVMAGLEEAAPKPKPTIATPAQLHERVSLQQALQTPVV